MISLTQTLDLPVSTAELWSFVRDTDRLNRLIGLPPIEFQKEDEPGHYAALLRFAGYPLRYHEFPFEWVENRYHRVTRAFASGPLAWVSGGVRMEPTPTGTRCEIFAEAEPRRRWAAWIARSALRKLTVGRVAAAIRRWAALRAAERPAALVEPELFPAFESRLAALKNGWAPDDLVGALETLIRTGSDIAVSYIRPFELAQAWGRDRYDVIGFLLKATKAGLLDLSWRVVCPHCAAPVQTTGRLEEVTAEASCPSCLSGFRSDLAASVELTFSVNPGVRAPRSAVYCIGGPVSAPMIAAQFRLAPGARRTEVVSLSAGVARARIVRPKSEATIEVANDRDAASVSIAVNASGIVAADGATGAGQVPLVLENKGTSEILLSIERDGWRKNAASAATVLAWSEFRALFPEQVVGPGQEVSISRLALLFTDLEGSTELYERVGDVKAFAFVQRHFEFLLKRIARFNGAPVKTMGDAIMAAFAQAADGVRAALDMQRDWNAFLDEAGAPSRPRLKIGLHEGPAVAINNKGALDYFGTTVNMAARVQAQSGGGEIVLSEALHADEGARAALAARGLSVEPFSGALKGIAGEQRLYRLR